MAWPLTKSWFSVAFASPLNRPCTESYFNMYAMYSASIKGSLMPTIFALGFSKAARKTKRPIRPKPLIPIFVTVLPPGQVAGLHAQPRCSFGAMQPRRGMTSYLIGPAQAGYPAGPLLMTAGVQGSRGDAPRRHLHRLYLPYLLTVFTDGAIG